MCYIYTQRKSNPAYSFKNSITFLIAPFPDFKPAISLLKYDSVELPGLFRTPDTVPPPFDNRDIRYNARQAGFRFDVECGHGESSRGRQPDENMNAVGLSLANLIYRPADHVSYFNARRP